MTKTPPQPRLSPARPRLSPTRPRLPSPAPPLPAQLHPVCTHRSLRLPGPYAQVPRDSIWRWERCLGREGGAPTVGLGPRFRPPTSSPGPPHVSAQRRDTGCEPGAGPHGARPGCALSPGPLPAAAQAQASVGQPEPTRHLLPPHPRVHSQGQNQNRDHSISAQPLAERSAERPAFPGILYCYCCSQAGLPAAGDNLLP